MALVYYSLVRYRRGAVVLGLLTLGHWLLDAIVHGPDLPICPGWDLFFGLGLWSSLWGTLAVEASIFVAGVWLYSRSTMRMEGNVDWALWTLAGFLLLVYMANLFGPPPPDEASIALAGQAQWLLLPWGRWVDKRRSPAL